MAAAALRRIAAALARRPTGRDWLAAAFEAAWSLPLALALLHAGGLAEPGWTEDSAMLARLALVALVAPALGEELLFRAALLPPPEEPAGPVRLAWPVALFVLWHPPQAWLFGPHWAGVVSSPWFLAAVAVLGVALTRLYRATGSVWPPAVLHWTAIMAWKGLFGGPSPWVGG